MAAGDTVPCAGLDRLCEGAQALVHTVIRKDIIKNIPIPRVLDTLDYHSSPAEAGQTAARAGIETLLLTHYFPPPDCGSTTVRTTAPSPSPTSTAPSRSATTSDRVEIGS